MKQNFVGFGTLEDLMQAMTHDLPVNVESISETTALKAGYSSVRDALVVSQVKAAEVIYHYFVTARYHAVNGQALAIDDGKSIGERSLSAYVLVRAFLLEAGFETRQALVAVPRSLKLLEGTTGLIRYDKASDRFERAVATEVPA